ncbi:hypothetical protein ACWEO4_44980 [Streptomyces sp. NPDC004393]|uniref:hypothetical protein n=1 Tax=Streptomyces sp. NPDC002573 TaxID=3364651 RepID=UPI003690810F
MRPGKATADQRNILRDWVIPLCAVTVSALLVTAVATEQDSGLEDGGRATFAPASTHLAKALHAVHSTHAVGTTTWKRR